MTKYKLNKETDELSKIDERFLPLVEKFGYSTLSRNADPFQSLVKYIVYQQLSGKAAGTIYQRFLDILPDKFVNPQNILNCEFNKLRSAGLSQRKSEYIVGLADTFLKKELNNEWFAESSSEEIKNELLKIRGIGIWTIEMLLMFNLWRLDIFPVSDLGVRRGFSIFTGAPKDQPWKEIELYSQKWSPYRSIAALYMWHIADDGFEW